MEVYLKNGQRKLKVDSRGLKNQVGKILRALGCQDKEISILLVSDARIRKLNHQYRNIDQHTDVLSFPQQEGEGVRFNSHLLGDVVVSAETARRQGLEHRLSLEEELVLLLIHGILHLLGYDHERSAKEAGRMRRKTRELFQMVFPGKKPAESCNY